VISGFDTVGVRKGTAVGVFKQVKDMNRVPYDAPRRIEEAQRMASRAQTLGLAYGARPAPLIPLVRTDGPDFEPIAAVSLELYAQISKSLATVDYDLSRSIRLAGDKGVSEENWAIAVEGWNARMVANPAVGTQFSTLYAAS
jgi:hypothetical protein